MIFAKSPKSMNIKIMQVPYDLSVKKYYQINIFQIGCMEIEHVLEMDSEILFAFSGESLQL